MLAAAAWGQTRHLAEPSGPSAPRPDIGKWRYLLKLPLRGVGEGCTAAAGLWTLDSECVRAKRIPEAHSICA